MWGKRRAGHLCSPSISPRSLGLSPYLREVQIQEVNLRESRAGPEVWRDTALLWGLV